MRAQLRMTMQGFAQVSRTSYFEINNIVEVCALCFIDVYFLIVTFGTVSHNLNLSFKFLSNLRFLFLFSSLKTPLRPIAQVSRINLILSSRPQKTWKRCADSTMHSTSCSPPLILWVLNQGCLFDMCISRIRVMGKHVSWIVHPMINHRSRS